MHIPIIKFDSLIKDAIMRKFHIPDKITLWILFLWHIFSFCIILQIIIKELPCEREVQHCRDFLQTFGQGRLVSWDMYTNLSIVHLYPFDHVIMLTLIPEYTFVEWETEIPSISFIRTKINEDDTLVFAQ